MNLAGTPKPVDQHPAACGVSPAEPFRRRHARRRLSRALGEHERPIQLLTLLVKFAFPIVILCVTVVSAVLGAMTPCVADVGRRPVDCSAKVNAAALKAMGQTGPHGQMQIWGDPVAFGPNLLRVEVDVFGGGEYDVDVTIDSACNVFSVTTRLESNGPP